MNHSLLSPDTDSTQVSKNRPSGLRVNKPGDAFEREADRVADTVSRGGRTHSDLLSWSLGAGTIQRQSTPVGQNAPSPNNYSDALSKAAEAFLKTKTGQDMVKHITEEDPLVKAATDFVKTPAGIAVTGAAATGAIAALAATHQPLPAQIPAIPLDPISSKLSGYKLQLTYQGPVDRPTGAMVTLSYEGKSSDKKKKQTDSERFRAETASIAADQAKFREGMQPKTGPVAEQQKVEQKKEDRMFQNWALHRVGSQDMGSIPDVSQMGKNYPRVWSGSSAAQTSPVPDKKLPAPATSQPAPDDAAKKKEELPVQRKALGDVAADLDIAEVESVLASTGRPLDRETRRYMESRIGFDFGKVRIHTDARAASSAKTMGSLAYTVGNDVVFASGNYAPNTTQGRRLLAHELTHVVQQNPAPKPVARSVPMPSPAPRRVQRWWNPLADIKEKALAKLRQIPGYELFCVILGKDLLTGKEVERNAENLTHGVLQLVPGGQDAYDRMKQSGAIDRAFAWLKAEVNKLNFSEQYFSDLFQRAKDAVDFTHLEDSWDRIVDIFREPYERVKTFASNVIHKVLEFVLEAAIEALGGKEIAQQILEFFRKAGTAIKTIVNDPAAFLGHLLDALKQGFGQFKDNIVEHLKNGLVQWLFGEIPGLTLPKKFTITEIIGMVLQVLGITYANFRQKLENVLGAPAVRFLEGAFEIVKTIYTQGMGAAWKLILEKAENLFDTIMESVRNWVITEVVKLAVAHLATMFNPIGGIIESIRVIYETIKFFIDKAKQIASLLSAIVDSIAEIASGNIAKAANWIEQSMAKAIPLILRFLAGLIGLGDVPDKIRGIIKAVRDKVDTTMQKVVDFVVEKAKPIWEAGKEAFTSHLEAVKEWWTKPRKFKYGVEDHELSLDGEGDHPQVMVASSNKTPLDQFLKDVKATGPQTTAIKAAAAKLKWKKGDPEKPSDKDEEGNKNFEKLKELMAGLKAMEAPKSEVTYSAPEPVLGGGQEVDALLSSNRDVGSEPEGDANDTRANPAIWMDLGYPHLRKEKRYIRGHLLSMRLGGLGVWKNMMPITNTVNQRMNAQVENHLKKATANPNRFFHYHITAKYDTGVVLPPEGDAKRADAAEKRLISLSWTVKAAKPKEGGGGLEEDPKGQLVDADGNPMPGTVAAGNFTPPTDK
jgi:hypothetical protein